MLISDQGTVRSSPAVPIESQQTTPPESQQTTPPESQQTTPPVQINVENADANTSLNSVEASAKQEVTVTDMEDEEFGSFVTVSHIQVESKTLSEQPVTITVAMPENESTKKPDDSGNNGHSELLDGTNIQGTDSKPDGKEVSSVDYSFTPELRNNVGKSVPLGQSPVKGVWELRKGSPGMAQKKSLVKTGSTKEKTGKRVVKKDSKRGRDKTRKAQIRTEHMDRSIDDNQSELSYQPDTDLSRSKASKKVNSKLESLPV